MGTCLILQAPDNRETGANPVRSRHCKPGAHNHCHVQPLIRSGLGRRLWVLSGKSGNLPVVGTGIWFQTTSNWSYRFTAFKARLGSLFPSDWHIGGNATFRHVCDRRFLTQTVNNCFCGKLLQGVVICIYSPGTVPQGMRVPVRMESDTQGIFPLSAVLWKSSAVSGVFLIPCRTAVKGRAPDVLSWGHCFKMAPEPIWF